MYVQNEFRVIPRGTPHAGRNWRAARLAKALLLLRCWDASALHARCIELSKVSSSSSKDCLKAEEISSARVLRDTLDYFGDRLFVCFHCSLSDTFGVLTKTRSRFPKDWARNTRQKESWRSFRNSKLDSLTSKDSRTLLCCGYSIAHKDSNCWGRRRRIIVRTEFLRRGLRGARTDCAHGRGTSPPGRAAPQRARHRYARWHTNSRSQAVLVECPRGETAAWMAGGSGSAPGEVSTNINL
jgi:hypothetical protein